MKYNLSDIERTLLSAYMDGELSEQEAAAAEQLLASTEEARLYLGELRAVEHLSTAAMAPSVGILAGSGTAGAKLTGSAIQAAAKKSLFTKTTTAGTWGIAGTVGLVATAAVGIALSFSSPKVQEPQAASPVEHTRGTAVQPVASSKAPQLVNVDTNNLIVPPMTPSDLVAFALHGTLPMDEGREQFLTLAPRGSDSLAVRVHNKAPQISREDLGSWNIAQAMVLDSIQRVIRTSVLQCSDQGIALRADIPALRLNVIRTLERAVPTMAPQLRERLDRCRTELMTHNEVVRQVEDAGGDLGTVRYIEFRVFGGANGSDDLDNFFNRPTQTVLGCNDNAAITVNGNSLRTLEAFARAEAPFGAAVAQAPMPEHGVIANPAGVRVVQKQRPTWNTMRRVSRLGALLEETEEMLMLPPAANGEQYNVLLPAPPELAPERNMPREFQVVQRDADTGAVMTRMKRARMELLRADSLLKHLRLEISRRVEEREKMIRKQQEHEREREEEQPEEGVSSGGGQ